MRRINHGMMAMRAVLAAMVLVGGVTTSMVADHRERIDFINAMEKATQQKSDIEDLQRRLLAVATPVTAQSRVLEEKNNDAANDNDDAANNNDDGSTFYVGKYALKYRGCQNIKTWSDNLAQDENSETVFALKRFVVFRLCPSQSCSSYLKNGCSSNYGEYMIPMEDYLAIMEQYQYSRFASFCSTCMECMNFGSQQNVAYQSDNSNYRRRLANDDEVANDEAVNNDDGAVNDDGAANDNGAANDDAVGDDANYADGDEAVGDDAAAGDDYYTYAGDDENAGDNARNNDDQNYNGSGDDAVGDDAAAGDDYYTYAGDDENAGDNARNTDDQNYNGSGDDAVTYNDDQNSNDDAAVAGDDAISDDEADTDDVDTGDDYYGYDDDTYKDDDNAGGNGQYSCQFANECANYKQLCRNYNSDIDTLRNFFTCIQFDAGNKNVYLGPHCKKDGYRMTIGIFEDDECTSYLGDIDNMQHLTGIAVSSNPMSFYTPSSCIQCSDQGQWNLGGGRDGDNDSVLCEALYDESAKCHQHLSSGNSYYESENQEQNQDNVCRFIESLEDNNYDEYGEINLANQYFDVTQWMHPQEYTKLMNPIEITLLVFSVSLCLGLLIYSCYLHSALGRKTPSGPAKKMKRPPRFSRISSGVLTQAGRISRINSGITQGRSREEWGADDDTTITMTTMGSDFPASHHVKLGGPYL